MTWGCQYDAVALTLPVRPLPLSGLHEVLHDRPEVSINVQPRELVKSPTLNFGAAVKLL